MFAEAAVRLTPFDFLRCLFGTRMLLLSGSFSDYSRLLSLPSFSAIDAIGDLIRMPI